ncbi:hypothetical protein H6801_03105 [Candidatus Nomurabacteria bacterium]|nr:hypothetical protein [Candidatus Nomurabacteria bacterium]
MAITKIKDAYKAGTTGEPDRTNSRLAGLAFRAGERSLVAATRNQEAHKKYNSTLLEQAKEKSRGLNKLALEAIAAIAQIPHQASTDPVAPKKMSYPEQGDRQTVGWYVYVGYGPSQDASREKIVTPLSQPLGVLKIDSTSWSHNGLELPVDNLVINTTGLSDGDYQELAIIGPSVTTLFVNTREYDPNDLNKQDGIDGFTGGAKIELDMDGSIVYLGLAQGGSSGYVAQPLEGLQINLEQFLQGVKSSAESTVNSYDQITCQSRMK